MPDLCWLTIHEARMLLERGEICSVELTRALLERIAALDSRVHAYITVLGADALADAEAADRRRGRGDSAPLLGIPLAIKDVICTRGVTTTCGSRMLKTFAPPYDATAVGRLREAGAILLGKTNTDEFAMGSSTEYSAFFTTGNPWNLECVPGGSSGGSAAAVAAGMAMGALGSDTGGSIRQPAALCGIVGLKPTYGRVSRYGLVAHGSSLDQIGPLTRDVEDAAILLGVIAGRDRLDSTSLDRPAPDYAREMKDGGGLRGLRVGVPKEYFVAGMEVGVEAAVRATLQVMADAGAELIDVSLPHTEYCIPIYYLVATAEASSNLARYDGVRYGQRVDGDDMWRTFFETRAAGFGAEVKRRIMLGTYVLSAGYYDAYYLKAQQARTLLRRDFERAFQQVDILACPVSPTVAFKRGQKVDDPLQMYLMDVFTVSLNLVGMCGIAVPCGFSEGLPVGLQLMGPALGESAILRAAHAYQQAASWHKRRPPQNTEPGEDTRSPA